MRFALAAAFYPTPGLWSPIALLFVPWVNPLVVLYLLLHRQITKLINQAAQMFHLTQATRGHSEFLKRPQPHPSRPSRVCLPCLLSWRVLEIFGTLSSEPKFAKQSRAKTFRELRHLQL
jgi:hypothetical protein